MINTVGRRIDFHFVPQGKVLHDFYHDRSQFSAIMGPLGSGKTIQTCQKIFRLMCEQPPNAHGIRPSRWIAVRNTYSDLKTTTAKDWLALFGDIGVYKAGGSEPPSHTIECKLPDGTILQSELIFLAADREDHVRKFRGVQCTGLWLNELKELPKALLDIADLRHGRYPSELLAGVECGWHGIVGDLNAPDEDHWYHTLAETDKPEGYAFFRQPGGVVWDGSQWIVNEQAENLANLPDNYYERGVLGKSQDWIKVNLANEYGFSIDGRPIYPEFSESLHVSASADYADGVRLYRGWDFGLTPACVYLQVTRDGRVFVFDEIVSKRASIDLFSDQVLSHTAREYGEARSLDLQDFGDPSGNAASQAYEESSCFEILLGKGVRIEGSDQSPVIRKESTRSTMTRLEGGKPMLMVHPRCKTLIKALKGGYCYRRLKISGERYADKPDKNEYSHVAEAFEYVMARLFGDRVRGQTKPKDSTPIRRAQTVV